MRKYRLLIISATLLLPAWSRPEASQLRAYVETEAVIAVPGERSYIPVKIEIPAGYHIYANPKGPGTGRATELRAGAQKDFLFEPARYLPGKEYRAPGEKKPVFIYEKETRVFLPFTVREKTSPGERRISMLVESLLCGESTCIPLTTEIGAAVDIRAAGTPVETDSSLTALFMRAAAPGKSQPDAIPDKDNTGSRSAWPLSSSSFSPRYPGSAEVTGLFAAIIFGLIAGFLLNFMPCVLPVVSLKIMALMRHSGESRKGLALMGVLFSAGILASFAILAALAAFWGYSWGGLFQRRAFLVAMTSIVFILALSMLGVFTLNTPAFAGKFSRSISSPRVDALLKGFLATLLATPCSGPLLGGTLAWALTQRPLIIFTVFMSVGAGMALPYLVLTAFPSLIKRIPKPGEWTRAFEEIMGFLLVFTVVYLLSIFSTDELMSMIMFLAFTAAAFWQYGRFGAIHRKRRERLFSAALVFLILAGGYALSFHYFFTAEKGAVMSGTAFSGERLIRNRERGIISVVKFTADWCPNCRYVEARALNTESVRRAMSSSGRDFMTADITRESPEAMELMMKLGSRSIPLLAVFPAGDDFVRPLCLRDIYSEGDVLDALSKAEKSRPVPGGPVEYRFQVKQTGALSR